MGSDTGAVPQVTWTAFDGTVIDLTDINAGYAVLGDGTRGLRSVGYELTTQKYAGVDGETVQAIRAVAGEPTLGLLVSAETADDFIARSRMLRRAMRPKVGPGQLSVRRTSGEQRTLTCYCVGGLEGDESPDQALEGRWWKLALKFYAADPWWYGPQRTLTAGGLGGTSSPFFPLPPLSLSASSVFGSISIDLSDCDAPSYPVWTITGPGSAVRLTNKTTNRVIEVDTTLLDGQSLIINTQPGYQSVKRDSVNMMGALATDPAMWPLVEDVNDVDVSVAGATGASQVSVTYAPRYAGI